MTNDITIIRPNEQQADEKSVEVCLKEENVRHQTKSARELFNSLQCELDEIEDDIKDGLSYLDMKNDTLLSYMIDLCNIVLRKVRGEAISGHPSVERSVYYRVILEKIKAIDQRLAYQLNKVITMPDNVDEEQGVNVANLDVDLGLDDEEQADHTNKQVTSKRSRRDEYDDHDDDEEHDDEEDDDEDDEVDDEDGEDSEQEGSVDNDDDDDDDLDDGERVEDLSRAGTSAGVSSKKPAGIYKPPKLRSVAYNDGKESNIRRRRDYNEFYQDDDDNRDIVDESHARRDDERRTRYEEENYTRLPDDNPKKSKRKLRAKFKSKGGKKFKGSRRK